MINHAKWVHGIMIIGSKVAKPSQVECNRRYRAKLKQDRDEGRLQIEKLIIMIAGFKSAMEKDKATIAELELKVATMAADSTMGETQRREIAERDVTIKEQEEFIDELRGELDTIKETMAWNPNN